MRVAEIDGADGDLPAADVREVAAVRHDLVVVPLDAADLRRVGVVEEVDDVEAGPRIVLDDGVAREGGVARRTSEGVEDLDQARVVGIADVDEIDVAAAIEDDLLAEELDVVLDAVDG